MIKQIQDIKPDELDGLRKGHYSRRIRSHYDAYSTSYDFCRFFLLCSDTQNFGIISLFNSSMIFAEFENAILDDDCIEDMALFVNMNKPMNVEMNSEYAQKLFKLCDEEYSLEERHQFEFVCKNNLPPLEVNELPSLDSVFAILKTSFPSLENSYALWLTDTSHRVRRGYSQAFMLGNYTTATIQYIVGDYALIGHVATIPEMRGKHHARRLLYWIGERLNQDGITVCLFARNHRKSYYEEIGFREIGMDYVLDRKTIKE